MDVIAAGDTPGVAEEIAQTETGAAETSALTISRVSDATPTHRSASNHPGIGYSVGASNRFLPMIEVDNPEFVPKAADAISLYLNPPLNALEHCCLNAPRFSAAFARHGTNPPSAVS